MKAIVQHEYGSPDNVLELQDVDKPVVEDDEILVRVHAASVHPYKAVPSTFTFIPLWKDDFTVVVGVAQ